MSTTRSRILRHARTLAAAGAVAVALAAVPSSAHAMPRPPDSPPAGTLASAHLSNGYCATWRSTGDAWVYVGLSNC